MIKINNFIKLQEVLSRVLRHPLLLSVTLEAAILYTVDFIHIFGLPDMFQDKEEVLTICNYKALLPCDLISVNQVLNTKTNECIRSMTNTFNPVDEPDRTFYKYSAEDTFKIQGNILITSFKDGEVKISYKSIPVDEYGYPLIIDNSNYLKALELYIKKEAFTILFDTGKINTAVLQKAELDYAWAAGKLQSEFNIPSESEMESLCRSWCTLVLHTTDFSNGWRGLGNREYLKKH